MCATTNTPTTGPTATPTNTPVPWTGEGRNSITAFTGGSAVLPFTYGPGGPFLPGAPQGWSYTA